MSVPKHIHCIWIGKDMPVLYKRCIESWKTVHPDWDFSVWDESIFLDDIPAYFQKAMSDNKVAFASDYLRCYILKKHGGIYVDADMECVKNFHPLLEESFLGYEAPDRLSNGVMAFEANHILIDKLLEYYDNNVGVYKAIPRITTNIVNECNISIKVYPECFFYPYNPYRENSLDQLMYSDIKDNTYAIHHWGKSWNVSRVDALKNIFIQKVKSLKWRR
ncbi:glycosyltransferase family 32 protein [Vibrio pelagius]|uniref:glycosyltransferase family 32 protein n=1 Tax=Vibrio pelagius TaxID=28169 RepID=UPI0021C33C1C|nr:glycosyltransferase [Vibrio pelagius]